MPQANSTTSMPRVTSPCASVKTLPCSEVIIAARVSRCAVEQAEEGVEHPGPAQRRRVGPGRLRRLRGGDRGVDLVDRGERDPARDRAGRRVVDRLAAPARAGDAPAADEMADVSAAGEMLVGTHGENLSVVDRFGSAPPIGRRAGLVSEHDAQRQRRRVQQHRVGRVPHQQRDLVDDRAQRDTSATASTRVGAVLRSTPCRRSGC